MAGFLLFFCIMLLIVCIFKAITYSPDNSLSHCIEDDNLKTYEHVSMIDSSNNDLYNTLISIFKSGQTYGEYGKDNGFEGNNEFEIYQLVDDHFTKLIENINNEHDKDILDALHFSLSSRSHTLFLTNGKGLILNPKETCYFRGVNSMVHTIQTLLKDISYCGVRYGTGMLRAGNMFVSRNDITGWKEYGQGTMYVTNQRVILIGRDNKAKNIPLGNIANYSIFENNGIIFTLKNGNPVIFSLPLDGTFHFNTQLGTIFEDDLCQCLFALNKAFEERNK